MVQIVQKHCAPRAHRKEERAEERRRTQNILLYSQYPEKLNFPRRILKEGV